MHACCSEPPLPTEPAAQLTGDIVGCLIRVQDRWQKKKKDGKKAFLSVFYQYYAEDHCN